MSRILVERAIDEGVHYWWWCPGCDQTRNGMGLHVFDSRWTFNGDFDSPSFDGSYLANSTWAGEPTICHSFIRNGQIEYLTDCTHPLAGQTVPMPPIPDDWFDAS